MRLRLIPIDGVWFDISGKSLVVVFPQSAITDLKEVFVLNDKRFYECSLLS